MYRLNGDSILRDDGASIPYNPDNKDYQVYLTWLKAGNVPETMPTAPKQEKGPTLADISAKLSTAIEMLAGLKKGKNDG